MISEMIECGEHLICVFLDTFFGKDASNSDVLLNTQRCINHSGIR